MNEKEFRHLSRRELVDIIYELEKKIDEKNAEIEDLRKQLEDRRIRINKAGSIAEASLALNKVFEDAQKAADQYVDEIRQIKEETTVQARKILAEAQQRAEGNGREEE